MATTPASGERSSPRSSASYPLEGSGWVPIFAIDVLVIYGLASYGGDRRITAG